MIVLTVIGAMVVVAVAVFAIALRLGSVIFDSDEGLGIVFFALVAAAVSGVTAGAAVVAMAVLR